MLKCKCMLNLAIIDGRHIGGSKQCYLIKPLWLIIVSGFPSNSKVIMHPEKMKVCVMKSAHAPYMIVTIVGWRHMRGNRQCYLIKPLWLIIFSGSSSYNAFHLYLHFMNGSTKGNLVIFSIYMASFYFT